MNALFLYTELAPYFLNCVKLLVSRYEVDAHIFMWPINQVAPFDLKDHQRIRIENKAAYTYQELLAASKNIDPDIIYVSGWLDKDYLKIARHFRKAGKIVICAMDNQWTGNWRQRLASLISWVYFKPRFSHLWVAGLYQFEFAGRLGYARTHILWGLYAADQARFHQAFLLAHQQKKARTYPHTFLYVGRLAPEKGAFMLYHIFKTYIQPQTDWKLIMIGTGAEARQMPSTEHIDMRGFVQADKLIEVVKEAGCLVCPSLDEPWGVVIHEFAAAGLPMVVSELAGAATAFVRHGYNAYLFDPHEEKQLIQALLNIAQHTDEDLLRMGERSAQLSFQITPESWAATLMSAF